MGYTIDVIEDKNLLCIQHLLVSIDVVLKVFLINLWESASRDSLATSNALLNHNAMKKTWSPFRRSKKHRKKQHKLDS